MSDQELTPSKSTNNAPPPPYSTGAGASGAGNTGGGGGTGSGAASGGAGGAAQEHLNIKVTDNNNEVFFKIKRTTQLKKLMDAFCDRQGKMPSTVRFLFEGTRVQGGDTPDTVSFAFLRFLLWCLGMRARWWVGLELLANVCGCSATFSSTCKMVIHWRCIKNRLVVVATGDYWRHLQYLLRMRNKRIATRRCDTTHSKHRILWMDGNGIGKGVARRRRF